jgi:Cof subfamily protein (haloacid dehalogenase superfamily)
MTRAPLPDHVRPGGRFDAWTVPDSVAYLASDVDGTLVGTGTRPSPRVADAVAGTVAAGVRVGIVTGRMRDAVRRLRTQLGVSGPHVLHNGAEVVDDDDVVLADWTLTSDQVEALLAIGRAHADGVVEIYTRSGFVASSLDARAEPHWEIVGTGPRDVVTSSDDLDGEAVLKATYTAFSPATAEAVRAAVVAEGMNAGPATSPRTPQLRYVNATHPGADKGQALRAVARHLDVDLAACVALGDAGNDLPMFAAAGTAVAMGDAPDEVVAAAHLVVPDVADDGAAVALELARRLAAGR